jgi:polar amino acid transport system substrate-binding protein
LKKKGFPKDIPISFLSDKSVVAFQKAHQFLGAEFGEIAGHNANYEEITQQHLQVNLLFVREVDFIVMDRSVFGYFWKKAVEQEYPGDERFLQEVQVHELFSKSIYHYLFLEKAVRDQFDLGLKKIREQGVYDQLVKQYAKAFQEYRPTAPATP